MPRTQRQNPGVGQFLPTISAEPGPPFVDAAIAALAARQHGVVSRAQLRELGLGDSTIGHRVATGRLHRVHQGVFCVGHQLLSQRGRWSAAVLACGPGAVLSHASAAALWEMRRSAAVYADVTIRRTGRRTRPGLRIHRPRTLPTDETTTHEGIPTTTPARTVLDLAATLSPTRLNRLLDQAEILELTDYPSLVAIARAHPGHHGATKLERALRTHYAGTTLTNSDLEVIFLELCRKRRLPMPLVNADVAGKEVDFLFADARLIVETDSWRYHKTRHAFENDRARDVLTSRAGYRTLRFTDRQLEREPRAVAEAIAAMSDRRAA
jgi:very-short-patch-repair endonuclease